MPIHNYTRKDGTVMKSGRLTDDDKRYIKATAGTKSDKEIGDHLGKNEKTVHNYRVRELGIDPNISPEDKEYIQIRAELRKLVEYSYLKDQFTKREIEFFEKKYAQLMAQYRNDILETEKMQLFQVIEIDMFRNRVKTEMANCKRRKARLQDTINEWLKNSDEDQDGRKNLAALEAQVTECEHIQNQKLTEYNNLRTEQGKLLKDLKSTREQRMKQFERSSTNFVSLIKSLDDTKRREAEARQMELIKLAQAKEYARLSKPHKYFNGDYDLPVLTPETIEANADLSDDDSPPNPEEKIDEATNN